MTNEQDISALPVREEAARGLDLEPIKRSLPPVGFWSYPWEKTLHQLIAEVERLRALLVVPGREQETKDQEDHARIDSHG